MGHTEGVIKFTMDYMPKAALPADELAELSAWRDLLVLLRVIGQDVNRYEGYGFGNISRRLDLPLEDDNARPFVITGTQTGEIGTLSPAHFVVVEACFPEQNRIVASGPIAPSSESMTHGALYAVDSAIRWVMHGHSPELWSGAAELALPTTDAAVPYGTPAMSAEVARLYRTSDLPSRRMLAMGGHEDGIVTFGASAPEAFQPWMDALIALKQIHFARH